MLKEKGTYMSNNKLDTLDFDTLVCFTLGLIEVAKVDGIQPKEREYIERFFINELSYSNENRTIDFDTLVNTSFNQEELKKFINTSDLKNYFLKSCIMLACVDSFSDEEKTLVRHFSELLSVQQEELDKLIKEVQYEIMEQFKDIKIYADSLQEVGASIGISY